MSVAASRTRVSGKLVTNASLQSVRSREKTRRWAAARREKAPPSMDATRSSGERSTKVLKSGRSQRLPGARPDSTSSSRVRWAASSRVAKGPPCRRSLDSSRASRPASISDAVSGSEEAIASTRLTPQSSALPGSWSVGTICSQTLSSVWIVSSENTLGRGQRSKATGAACAAPCAWALRTVIRGRSRRAPRAAPPAVRSLRRENSRLTARRGPVGEPTGSRPPASDDPAPVRPSNNPGIPASGRDAPGLRTPNTARGGPADLRGETSATGGPRSPSTSTCPLQDHALRLVLEQRVHRQAELALKNVVGVLAPLRAARQRGRRLVELHRVGDEGEAAALAAVDLLHVAVRERLAVGQQLARLLHRRPRALHVVEGGAPLVERARREHGVELRDAGLAVLEARLHVAVARIGRQLGPPDAAAEVRPVAVCLEHHEHHPALVASLVAVHARVEHLLARHGRERLHLGRQQARGDDVGREHPHRRVEQRDVHDGACAGALAREQRGRDPPGDGHAADAVAEGGALAGRLRGARWRERIADAATRPERARVVAAEVRLGP